MSKKNTQPRNYCLFCGQWVKFNFGYRGWSFWATPTKILGMVHDACEEPEQEDLI